MTAPTDQLLAAWDDLVALVNRLVDLLFEVFDRIRYWWNRALVLWDNLLEEALGVELPPVPPANVRNLRRPPRDLRATEAPRSLQRPHHYARRNR